jgi:hypothetical protein
MYRGHQAGLVATDIKTVRPPTWSACGNISLNSAKFNGLLFFKARYQCACPLVAAGYFPANSLNVCAL